MAIKALNLHTIKTVTHPDDKDAPTKFEIGVVDSRVLGMLQDKATSLSVDANDPDADTGVSVAQNEVTFLIAQFGLKGFSNLQTDAGSDILYETERKVLGAKAYEIVKADILASLPQDVIRWLADKVSEMNTLSKSEGKK